MQEQYHPSKWRAKDVCSMTDRLCPKPFFSWHLLPIFLGITAFCGMVTTYFLAKQNCHIEKWFLPYISYTGTEHPESSVFGLLLNVEGFLGVVVVIIAWRFMRHMGLRTHLNGVALVAGILSCFGVIMVGNFQVSKNKVPHYIGAALAFIVGAIYCTLSSILTHRIHRSMKKRPTCSMFVCVLRYTATGIMIMSIIILLFLAVLRMQFNATQERVDSKPVADIVDTEHKFRFPNGSCIPIIHKVPIYKRYLDLAGSILEWLLTICLLFSLALYAYEFKRFNNVKIILKKQGTELSVALLQSRSGALTSSNDGYNVLSPTSSILPSYSDTTMVVLNVPDTVPSQPMEYFTVRDQHMYKNNNKELHEKDSSICKSDISRSLPNISSSDIEDP